MSTVSRRDWLRTTGLGLGAGVALPGLLPAMEASRALGGASYGQILAQLERDATTARRLAGPVRLATNENPYGMSPKAKEAIMGAWAEHAMYQLPIRDKLREVFAKSVGVPADHVLVTQGSSEVLAICSLAFAREGGDVVVPYPTFEDVPRISTHVKANVVRVPLDDRFDHDLYQMDQKIGSNTRLVFVCNPNNPTGTLGDDTALREFVSNAARRAPVLVDEAYFEFVELPGHKSMVDKVLAGENIIISRTASKIHGLAGLRIGFAIARPDLIKQISGYATGAPNAFGMEAAAVAIGDVEYQQFTRVKNTEGRAIMHAAFTKLGRKFMATQTNFVFFHAGRPVAEMQKYYLDRGFMIGRAFPPFTDWCRISIGTPDEMRRVAALLPGAFA